MSKLKVKFAFSFLLLTTLVISLVAYVLIDSEKKQILNDILFETYNFTELTKDKFNENINSLLLKDQAVSFESVKNSLLLKNSNLDSLDVYKFNGDKIFGKQVSDAEIQRVKNALTSLKLKSGKVFYVDNQNDKLSFKNENGQTIEGPDASQLVNWVVPLPPNYALSFDLNYDSLNQRIEDALQSIILLFLLISIVSVALATVFASRLTKPISLLTAAVRKIAEGDLNQKVNFHSKDEVGMLSNSVNQMAHDLKLATEAKIYQARVTKELELATKIQNDLLPSTIPNIEGVDVHASVTPASEVGGDIFDVLVHENSNLLYLGDVTGHGIPASLISSTSSALMLDNSHKDDLLEITRRMNFVLQRKTPPNMFITLLMLKIKGEKFKYVSAGHKQIIRFSVKTGEVDLLPGGGIALGLFPSLPNTMLEQVYDFKTGDVIIIYSDGIPEAYNHQSQQYGMIKLQNSLRKNSTKDSTAKQIHDAIIKDVNEFRDGYQQMDDISLMVIKKV